MASIHECVQFPCDQAEAMSICEPPLIDVGLDRRLFRIDHRMIEILRPVAARRNFAGDAEVQTLQSAADVAQKMARIARQCEASGGGEQSCQKYIRLCRSSKKPCVAA